MKPEEPTTKSGFTLGQLPSWRIHNYIHDIYVSRKEKNLRVRYDVLEQWYSDVSYYCSPDEQTSAQTLLRECSKGLDRRVAPPRAEPFYKMEQLLHHVSERSGLKGMHAEVQQIVSFEDELREFEAKIGGDTQ